MQSVFVVLDTKNMSDKDYEEAKQSGEYDSCLNLFRKIKTIAEDPNLRRINPNRRIIKRVSIKKKKEMLKKARKRLGGLKVKLPLLLCGSDILYDEDSMLKTCLVHNYDEVMAPQQRPVSKKQSDRDLAEANFISEIPGMDESMASEFAHSVQSRPEENKQNSNLSRIDRLMNSSEWSKKQAAMVKRARDGHYDSTKDSSSMQIQDTIADNGVSYADLGPPPSKAQAAKAQMSAPVIQPSSRPSHQSTQSNQSVSWSDMGQLQQTGASTSYSSGQGNMDYDEGAYDYIMGED